MIRITAYFCTAVLCAFLLLGCLPIRGEEALYDNMIRLHVVAVSDADKDQQQKLAVRDAVLDLLAASLEDASCFGTARDTIHAMIPAITETVEQTVPGVPVCVTLEREPYPIRYYEDYVLPAGEYTSLRIVLGNGEGRNWWCILFPQLCITRAEARNDYEDFIAAGFSPDQYHLIRRDSSTKYKIRFRILEIFSSLFSTQT